MRAVLFASVVAATGCDSVFSVDHVGTDAHMRDSASAICLQDMFDGTLDTNTWMVFGFNGGVGVRVEGGLLQLDVPQQTTASQDPYGGVRSGTRNLTGASFEVELLQVPSSTTTSFAGELYRFDPTNAYSWFVQKGQIVARRYIAGVVRTWVGHTIRCPTDSCGCATTSMRTSSSSRRADHRRTGSSGRGCRSSSI